jgi:hypothetical protein
MARTSFPHLKFTKAYPGGFVVETPHEVLAFAGFEDERELQEAVDKCLESLNRLRCRHCGALKRGGK